MQSAAAVLACVSPVPVTPRAVRGGDGQGPFSCPTCLPTAFQDVSSADQKAASVEYASCGEAESFANGRKKAKTDVDHRHSPPQCGAESPPCDSAANAAAGDAGKGTETDSEPEEGEITDSHTEGTGEEEEDGGSVDTEEEGESRSHLHREARRWVYRNPAPGDVGDLCTESDGPQRL